MSGFTSFGGSGAAINANATYDPIGWNETTAAGVTVTSDVSAANTKGAWAPIGTSTSAWSGFWVRIMTGGASASANRYLVDFGTDNSTANLVANVFVQPGATTGTRYCEFFVPLQVATSTTIYARCQVSSGTSQTMTMIIMGVVANSSSPPGFTSATALTTADTANTRASTTVLTMAGGGTPLTWTDLVTAANMTQTYNALLLMVSASTTGPTTSQPARLSIATGVASSEVAVAWAGMYLSSVAPSLPFEPRLLDKTFSSGVRLSGNIQTATPGTDNATVGLIGFR